MDRQISHFSQALAFGLAISLSVGQALADDDKIYGEPAEMGNGTVSAFYQQSPNGTPLAVGIELTSTVLQNLPQAPSDGLRDIKDKQGAVVMPCCGHEMVLDLPADTITTPFKQFVINYEPHGHPPAGVYNKEHFDFHFYLADNDERLKIAVPIAEDRCLIPGPDGVLGPTELSCSDFETAMADLPQDMQVPGYQSVGAVVPGMGNHLLNLEGPEFHGQPFTHSWLVGTWNGEITFFEPMISTDFLTELTDKSCFSYPMPETMPEEGWYPSEYCMQYDNVKKVYQVSLENWKILPRTSDALG